MFALKLDSGFVAGGEDSGVDFGNMRASLLQRNCTSGYEIGGRKNLGGWR